MTPYFWRENHMTPSMPCIFGMRAYTQQQQQFRSAALSSGAS